MTQFIFILFYSLHNLNLLHSALFCVVGLLFNQVKTSEKKERSNVQCFNIRTDLFPLYCIATNGFYFECFILINLHITLISMVVVRPWPRLTHF